MCGIAGEHHFNSATPADPARVEAMAQAIAHRGPDDKGMFVSGPVGLGFRRLSIIDVAGGHQPMSNPSETVWVAFNGEIYNFRELRRELEGHGHTFRTRSDTEVIIHAYEQWGPAALGHLNGMFAMAIWDSSRERLLLARDRAGVKPLYYHLASDRISFGSEIRAVVAGLDARPRLDPVALNLFLRYRYTPSPLTPYEGIRKLAAGTLLVIENGVARTERWWDYEGTPLDVSVSTATADLRDLYNQAVERQLVSDVPLGLLLSGGVDSGLLLALMNQHGADWRTFTVGFGSSFADDELALASETARRLGSQHAQVQIDQQTFESSLSRIVSIVEEPVASASIVPMFFLCALAREHVTVALMGQGPDELFGGYRRHFGVRYGAHWRSLPPQVRGPLSRALAGVPRNDWLRRALSSLAHEDRLRRYQDVFSLLPGPAVDGLFQDGVLPDEAGDVILDCWRVLEPLVGGADELGGFQQIEVNSSLPDELLLYADKLSMHHGLELRVPYLDHDIIEYAARLPAALKVRRGTGKWVHKQVAQQLLPHRDTVRKKRGFAVNVVDDWFRASLNSRLGEVLCDDQSLVYGLLRPDPVRGLVRQHQDGKRDNHKILFSLVVLEMWLRESELSPAV
ncbi:MAG: asparagine synthase (glutamine-hydrolyzing) [Actinomycetota bacterium]|nr:asparagine synthase (glutamine-hydrolyzing) [Actinomycetota bacterium]